MSLGIWHSAVKLYMVHHLLQYLPGYRKLKALEERLHSHRECHRTGRSQRWGWACQVQTPGLRLASLSLWRSCICKGALGKSPLLILIVIKAFRCLSELWSEIPGLSLPCHPAHPWKRERNSRHLWLPELPGYLLSCPTQSPLRKNPAPDLFALHIFFLPKQSDSIKA